MANKGTPRNTKDDYGILREQIRVLEERIFNLENNKNPTLPIYDSTLFPQEAVQGQVALDATLQEAWAFTNNNWWEIGDKPLSWARYTGSVGQPTTLAPNSGDLPAGSNLGFIYGTMATSDSDHFSIIEDDMGVDSGIGITEGTYLIYWEFASPYFPNTFTPPGPAPFTYQPAYPGFLSTIGFIPLPILGGLDEVLLGTDGIPRWITTDGRARGFTFSGTASADPVSAMHFNYINMGEGSEEDSISFWGSAWVLRLG